MADSFTDSQLRFVRRFAEALFHGFPQMAIPLDTVMANFEKQFEMIGGTAFKNMRKNLDRLSIYLNLFHDFNDMELNKRKKFVEKRFQFAKNDIAQDAARLKAVVYAAYYGHWIAGNQHANSANPVHQQIGFTLPDLRQRPADEQITPVTGFDINPAHVLGPGDVPAAADVIVIGSGSGGAVAALNFAARGYAVLVIEAGPFVPMNAVTAEERRMGALLYKHGTLQMTTDNDIVIFQGRSVGGSPIVNNGICLRMTGEPGANPHAPDALAGWRAAGAVIDAPQLEASYQAVEDYLELDRAPDFNGRGNGAHLYQGWNAFAAGKSEPWIRDARPHWFLKNFGDRNDPLRCKAAGYCNTGCPYARKRSMTRTYLRDACHQHQAHILPDTKVDEIVWDGNFGRGVPVRALGVRVIVGAAETEHQITARVGVVVAAGTIASSKLLQRSKVKGTGKGISLNIASPVVALMPAASSPSFDEDQMTTAVDCGEFLLESHFQPPQSMAMLMPGWFEEMDRRMRAYGRLRSAGVLFPVDRTGHLEGDELEVDFSDRDEALMRKALATLTKVHFAAGAEEVWPALRTARMITRAEYLAGFDIDAFFKREVREKDDVTLSSAHPHGGNPIHEDPRRGVVDSNCRLHGASNVLVGDASVFPASIRVNAQFTVMAMAHYATGRYDPFRDIKPL